MMRIIRKLVAPSCFVVMSSILMVKSNAFLMNELTNSGNLKGFQSIRCELKLAKNPLEVDNENVPFLEKGTKNLSLDRRDFFQKLSFGLALISPSIAQANGFNKPIFGKFQRDSVMAATGLQSESAVRSPINIGAKTTVLSSELCLLSLLPVSNKTFRTLQQQIEDISFLRDSSLDEKSWRVATQKAQNALQFLDSKRGSLEPKFNENDDVIMQIMKGERGEDLIENLRDQIVLLEDATRKKNETAAFERQKEALIALCYLGELLVEKFPYEIPKQGKYSYLPRLMGRARVTFSMERDGNPLGDITIIADGYTAPITAGNFVDLSTRGFYTGLTMKNLKKKLSSGKTKVETQGSTILSNLGNVFQNDEIDDANSKSINLRILGSFNEGFYDPLTAKLRRLPLEILRIDKATGVAEPTYPSSFTGTTQVSTIPDLTKEVGTMEDNALVLNFNIPGLVAMNHPDKNINGGSSEFFILSETEMDRETNLMLDGQYAPFGYIIKGYDLIQNLQAGDLIKSTTVSEYGLLNLVKIKGGNIQDLMGGE